MTGRTNYDDEEGAEPKETGTSDNMFMYTLPAMVDGISANISYEPTGSAALGSKILFLLQKTLIVRLPVVYVYFTILGNILMVSCS